MSDELRKRAEARIGTVLRERYRIDAVLGVGGMAVVYLATHRNNKRFAVKMLHPEIAIQKEAKQRFVREGYLANTVDHPGALSVLDDDVTEDGTPFIVMELLDGAEVGTLAENRGNALPAAVVLAIMDQVLAVLMAAHAKQIVHRDLKPANLFILRDGTVKVLDFGIARMRDALAGAPGALTQTGALLGTPAFLPPEQAGGLTHEIDGQTDLWAIGATMFTLLTGQYVHDADNATQIIIAAATQPARSLATAMPQAPPPLIALVDHALAFDKRYRWPDARAMRDANREAYRMVSGGALPTREALAEMFGIGNWETKWGELLQPPPGASGPALAMLRSASQSQNAASGFGPTAPMPHQPMMVPAPQMAAPPPHTTPLYVPAPQYPVNAMTTGAGAAASLDTFTIPKSKTHYLAIIGAVCAVIGLALIALVYVKYNDHGTVAAPPPKSTMPEAVSLVVPPPPTIPTAVASTTPSATANTNANANTSATATKITKPTATVVYSAVPAGSCHYIENFDAQGEKHFTKVCP